MDYNMTNEMKKIIRLALKKGTPFHMMSRNGKAVCFYYLYGMRVKGFSYANMQKAIPAELRRLA